MKIKQSLLYLLFIFATSFGGNSQVVVRDTVIQWQHHTFELNADHGLKSYSTNDEDIQHVQFNGKVIENELIRLVLVPEYGGRVLSFVYKPTGHENLYQSACGSPYGINEGNFYYNWLMVWGGIFPTFPEPEHGKTWLLSWNYEVLKNTTDTVSISMDYTDTTSFSGAPGKFNNGITGLTCQVKVSVYKGSSAWDFEVKLLNNKDQSVNYEYWTCTTLTPGSEPGETASPLSSEMVVPIEKYRADWSPGSWIGSYGSLYDFSRINQLREWNDMGIAYAHNLSSNFWGVINHDNNEGVFRISENIETPGMKFWTWGKNNVDNNMYDFSNGGADNYIELWAGVSGSFFSDAAISANSSKSWKETYSPTVGMNSVLAMNELGAANIVWKQATWQLGYELNVYQPFNDYRMVLYFDDESKLELANKTLTANLLGNTELFYVGADVIEPGQHLARFEMYNSQNDLVLEASKEIYIYPLALAEKQNLNYKVKNLGDKTIELELGDGIAYEVRVYNASGRLVAEEASANTRLQMHLPQSGMYIIQLITHEAQSTSKIMIF
ncbi:MAG: T9SS type A sorting domain-containing protein [Salinivirgaceae bacterium]